ncbi:MAG: YezD family protein [Opitutae bacterium]|nr:YezD family protein [Opitutae bacterium]
MNAHTAASAADNAPDWLRLVQEKVESLRYGVVQLVVHDGRVTQIERTEKTRLPSGAGAEAAPRTS